MLKSVFTVKTDDGLGAGFAGWTADGQLYVVTAAHVVAEVGQQVLLERNTGSWAAEVVARDRGRDLAVLRVDGKPVGAKPLWQQPRANKPRVGDALLLVGSPYGLGGTVTSGVVSRVRPKEIQTDAAANPGNSGGPAVDRRVASSASSSPAAARTSTSPSRSRGSAARCGAAEAARRRVVS